MHYKKLGPFIAHAIEHGKICYTSRELRKSLFHSKRAISLWISSLFMIGSFFFAFASFFSLWFVTELSSLSIGILYFTGSIFFTSAAYLQYLESINYDISHLPHLYHKHSRWFWWRWRPLNMGYLSSSTQFVGTLLFNLSTFMAIFSTLSIETLNLLVWVPNILGSILFLTSAFFGYLEIYHDTKIRAFFNITWWIVWINILGSIFFMISALYSAYTPEVHQFSLYVATLTTLLGAICFFIAALFLRFEKV